MPAISGFSLVLALVLLAAGPLLAIRRTVSERFTDLDRNGDGHLDPTELTRPRVFRNCDRNDDGKVTMEEASPPFSPGVRSGTRNAARGKRLHRKPDLHAEDGAFSSRHLF